MSAPDIAELLAEELKKQWWLSSHDATKIAQGLVAPDGLVAQLVADAETRGYERGRSDFQFRPEGDNHHNAALCPYCSPDRVAAIRESGQS